MKRFILLLLAFCCFGFSFGTGVNSEINLLAKEQVESRFLNGDHPIRYNSNILILLQGFPTREDSLIFNELIDTLNVLTDKWDVALIPKGTSNMTIEINLPHTGDWKNFFHQNNNQHEIIKSTVYLDLPDSLNSISRKKIIYYNILRALVTFNADQKKATPIPGSVFTESKAENITFHPVDLEIIKALYSDKYESTPKKESTIKVSSTAIKTTSSGILYSSLSLLLSFSFLIFMSLRGKFKEHNYSFIPFLKQGFLVIIACTISSIISTLANDRPSQSFGEKLFILFIVVATFFTVGFIAVVLIFLIERAILKRNRNFSLEIIVPFFSIALVTTAFIVLFLFGIPTDRTNLDYFALASVIITFSFLIGFSRSIYIYTRIKSENIIRKKDLELAQMNELHKQAELESLRAKINPHFLYNALNSIASLATTDTRKTEQMALALSDFFKYAINREQKQLNTISEELNAIRTYLEIEKVRFGERLNFEIDCPDELLDTQIPQLMIQPLVENAIKHGLSQIIGDGLIRIAVSQENSLLKIRVYDNGPAFPDEPLTGFGLRNIQERIAMLFGSKASVNWENGIQKNVEVSLPFIAHDVKKD